MGLSDENKKALLKATNGTNACLYFLTTIKMDKREKMSGAVYNVAVPIKVGISTSVIERMNQYHTYYQCINILGVIPLSISVIQEEWAEKLRCTQAKLADITVSRERKASTYLSFLEKRFIAKLLAYSAKERKPDTRSKSKQIEWFNIHSDLLNEVAYELLAELKPNTRKLYGNPFFFREPLISGAEDLSIEMDSILRQDFIMQYDSQTKKINFVKRIISQEDIRKKRNEITTTIRKLTYTPLDLNRRLKLPSTSTSRRLAPNRSHSTLPVPYIPYDDHDKDNAVKRANARVGLQPDNTLPFTENATPPSVYPIISSRTGNRRKRTTVSSHTEGVYSRTRSSKI